MRTALRGLRVLAVDDDERLLDRLKAALSCEVEEARVCSGTRSAIELLSGWSPDLVLLDVALLDGSAFDVLAALATRRPTPAVVAISGMASPAQAFRLAKLGVHTYLAKPFDVEALFDAMERALLEPIDLRPLVRGVVGKRPLQEVEAEVRETMVEEALARAAGARKGAARLLDTSRQVIQYFLRHR